MWERSAAVVILGTLDGLQGGHHVCCSAEAQQRAAAKRASEEQRRPWTWRTPVRVRKAMPIWSRIVGSGSTGGRHWHVPGACRAYSAAAAAVFVSKHAPPPRPCHVTASPRLIAASPVLCTLHPSCASPESSRVELRCSLPRYPKCCATHAARRCSRMQVLECSALQSIDDHHTKETVFLLPTACLLHTHPWAARCPRASPAQPRPTSLFGPPKPPYQRRALPAARLPAKRCLEPPPFLHTICPEHTYS
jgi:hypothetical protein